MTNEDIVKAIQNGFDVTENMQWLYQKNLPCGGWKESAGEVSGEYWAGG